MFVDGLRASLPSFDSTESCHSGRPCWPHRYLLNLATIFSVAVMVFKLQKIGKWNHSDHMWSDLPRIHVKTRARPANGRFGINARACLNPADVIAQMHSFRS
jgi:hypothetical protein